MLDVWRLNIKIEFEPIKTCQTYLKVEFFNFFAKILKDTGRNIALNYSFDFCLALRISKAQSKFSDPYPVGLT